MSLFLYFGFRFIYDTIKDNVNLNVKDTCEVQNFLKLKIIAARKYIHRYSRIKSNLCCFLNVI